MDALRVLLVDDSQAFLNSAEGYLNSLPLSVVGKALSGEEALQMVNRLHPDIVFMDINMPGLNGLEATRQIKSQPNPPCVIIVTLFDLPEYEKRATEAGADGFIAKNNLCEEVMPLLSSLFKPNFFGNPEAIDRRERNEE